MNDLQVFFYQDSMVRTVEIDGEVWVVAKDVCDVLGISNARDAIKSLDNDEKMTVDNSDGHSGQRGGAQFFNVINEAGVYKLAFRSNKPNAKAFTRWVSHEVIPAIRKTGHYEVPTTENKPAVVKKNKSGAPAHSGVIKAADKIYHILFNAKKEADFHEAVALDTVFAQTFGFSAIAAAGITIGKDETLRKYRGLKDKHGNVITHEYFWEHEIIPALPTPELNINDDDCVPFDFTW